MLLPLLSSSTLEDMTPFCQLSLAVPIWHITMEDQTPVCSRAHPGGVRHSSNAKNTPSQNNPPQLSPRQVWNTWLSWEADWPLVIEQKKAKPISKLLHQMVNARLILTQHIWSWHNFSIGSEDLNIHRSLANGESFKTESNPSFQTDPLIIVSTSCNQSCILISVDQNVSTEITHGFQQWTRLKWRWLKKKKESASKYLFQDIQV